MEQLILDAQTLVLNDANMRRSLKYNILPPSRKKPTESAKHTDRGQQDSVYWFVPREKDTLFWCFYRMKHGDMEYDMLTHKNEAMTRRLKIDLVQSVRNFKKESSKGNKMATSVESNLANDSLLQPSTFLALCAIHQLNVVFVRNRAMVEQMANLDAKAEVFGVRLNERRAYEYKMLTPEDLQLLRNSHLIVDHLDKPLKAVSAYTLSVLQTMADKLGISLEKPTKQALYEHIHRHVA